jgi:signal transduction histidine kinase
MATFRYHGSLGSPESRAFVSARKLPRLRLRPIVPPVTFAPSPARLIPPAVGMSLRAKVLALFAAFAIVPLLAIGVVDYARSANAVDALIQAQTAQIAQRLSADLRDRYDLVQANLALLADNAETQRLLRGATNRDATTTEREGDAYLQQIWNSVGDDLDWATISDSSGREIYRFGDREHVDGAGRVVVTTRSSRTSEKPATVTAAVRLARLLPADALASRFGREGYNVIVDRETGRSIFGAEHAAAILAALRLTGDTANRVAFTEGDAKRSATIVRLASPAWDVLSVAAVDEFGGPFAAIRSANLILVMLTAIFAGLAFFLLLWRATRSLGMLTLAADAVGRGNLQPSLPPASRDEVGRLSVAFRLMTDRVRETMAEIERSRQMAAVGEFAAQISHEIRNPLTSIKLNLQKMERAKRAGRLPPVTDKPLEITLREINRMDRVVHGVLQLGRSRATTHGRINVSQIVKETIDVASPQLERTGVTLRSEFASAGGDVWVRGDAALLSGALLNVILNAAEAAAGGEVFVDVEHTGSGGRVTIRDTGPGIPREHRERIFEPFFTTKEGGTGLGLALAQRTIEEHGGSLRLAEPAVGAAFVLELPIDDSAEVAP